MGFFLCSSSLAVRISSSPIVLLQLEQITPVE